MIGKAAVAPKRVEMKVAAPKAAPTGILSAPRMKDIAQIHEAETEKLTDKVVGGPFREQRLPVGICNVTLINGSWSGIEIKAGERTLLDPATLRVQGTSTENIYLLDPETGEEVGYFNPLSTPEPSLLPGRFVPRIGKFDWPALDLKPGQTAVLRLSGIRSMTRHSPTNSTMSRRRAADPRSCSYRTSFFLCRPEVPALAQ
jgi:hypothetical protein